MVLGVCFLDERSRPRCKAVDFAGAGILQSRCNPPGTGCCFYSAKLIFGAEPASPLPAALIRFAFLNEKGPGRAHARSRPRRRGRGRARARSGPLLVGTGEAYRGCKAGDRAFAGPIDAHAARQEREEDRRRAADHARRKARMEAGLPYWTDEEFANL